MAEENKEETPEQEEQNTVEESTTTDADSPMSEEEMAQAMAQAMAEQEQSQMMKEQEKTILASNVEDIVLPDLSKEERISEDHFKRELDFILDIPLDISVELGRTKLIINELLQLGQGSVIELNKLAGELLEIYVNGKLLARGEAVVINEKFGVRLTDIISPLERVKQLG